MTVEVELPLERKKDKYVVMHVYCILTFYLEFVEGLEFVDYQGECCEQLERREEWEDPYSSAGRESAWEKWEDPELSGGRECLGELGGFGFEGE